MWVHLTAKARQAVRPFDDDDACRWAWSKLRTAFPRVLAAVLMPNHTHILTWDPRHEGQRRLARVLAGFTRAHGVAGSFLPVPTPTDIPNASHALRQIRYLHLNPCRAGLVDDPLGWRWSTHRDVLGAVVDPWVDADSLADAITARPDGFGAWLHAYISADPSVCVAGTPAPMAAMPTALSRVALAEVAYAVTAATRAPLSDLRRRTVTRRLFLWMAREQGWARAAELAAFCAVTDRAVQGVWRGAEPAGASAARLCLGDRRLTLEFEHRRLQRALSLRSPSRSDGPAPKRH